MHVSEEVVGGPASNMRFAAPRGRIEYQEVIVHVLVDLHYSCLISAPVTVIWS